MTERDFQHRTISSSSETVEVPLTTSHQLIVRSIELISKDWFAEHSACLTRALFAFNVVRVLHSVKLTSYLLRFLTIVGNNAVTMYVNYGGSQKVSFKLVCKFRLR